MRKVLLALATVAAIQTSAQTFSESFSDGDFTANPAWSGTTTWAVVANSDVSTGATGSNTLRLDVPNGGGTQYLSTPISDWGTDQSWGFFLGRRAQAATASNSSYFWLYANEANVTSLTVDGYRISFGDDAGGDNIVLESVTNGVATPILTSTGSTPNGITDFGFLVRVTRSSAGLWTLYTSALPTASGSGAIATDEPNATNANALQGSVTNTTITSFTGGYIAVAAAHTTSAAARATAEFDQIRFSSTAGGPLPVKLSHFRAQQSGRNVVLSWSNLTEEDVTGYVVERSADGANFSAIGQLQPRKNNGGQADYEFTDGSPLGGNNFYRLKISEGGGKLTFSTVARIGIGGASSLYLYPNPVKGGTIGLQLNSLPPGDYLLRVYSAGGQLVRSKSLAHRGGSVTDTYLLGNLQKGIYTFEVTGGVKLRQQFVVE